MTQNSSNAMVGINGQTSGTAISPGAITNGVRILDGTLVAANTGATAGTILTGNECSVVAIVTGSSPDP